MRFKLNTQHVQGKFQTCRVLEFNSVVTTYGIPDPLLAMTRASLHTAGEVWDFEVSISLLRQKSSFDESALEEVELVF